MSVEAYLSDSQFERQMEMVVRFKFKSLYFRTKYRLHHLDRRLFGPPKMILNTVTNWEISVAVVIRKRIVFKHSQYQNNS